MDERKIEAVKALFAKADGTDYAKEADTYRAKAMELMVKYGIEETMLIEADDTRSDDIARERYTFTGKHKVKQMHLLNVIALRLNCQVFRFDEYKGNGKYGQCRDAVHLVGYESDREQVKFLFALINVQMFRELADADIPYGMHGKTFAAGFLSGFINRIRVRLVDMMKKARNEAASTGYDLVLKSRNDAVAQFIDAIFDKIKGGNRGARVNAQAAAEGSVAGSRADLGGTKVGRNGHTMAIGR